MAYKKDKLFKRQQIPRDKRSTVGMKICPPEQFLWNNGEEQVEMCLLGESTYQDLYDPIFLKCDEDDMDLKMALEVGSLKQWIYTDPTGELFEVCFLLTFNEDVELLAIRTRRKP